MKEGGEIKRRAMYTDVSFRSGIKYSEETAEATGTLIFIS